ncbi:hypothetical protein SKAU_G00047350 [Synaphobranchus kaupii]|uniref:Uncharacterized protein n=1 Tax=Synaphobranchus kaupii TaxID=118154 RepID=A0A9Q1G2G9_SYNKA|nr:hypothetical protein SKAU_G00047350 [Synaphobranchus kaupii]
MNTVLITRALPFQRDLKLLWSQAPYCVKSTDFKRRKGVKTEQGVQAGRGIGKASTVASPAPLTSDLTFYAAVLSECSKAHRLLAVGGPVELLEPLWIQRNRVVSECGPMIGQ